MIHPSNDTPADNAAANNTTANNTDVTGAIAVTGIDSRLRQDAAAARHVSLYAVIRQIVCRNAFQRGITRRECRCKQRGRYRARKTA